MNFVQNLDRKDWVAIAASFVALAALITTLGVESARPAPTPQKSQQPKITWSEKEIEVILSPGEAASRSLSFTSDKNLKNVVLEPAPELAPYLTLTPNSFGNVPASTAHLVQIDFNIPEDATLGDYDGTVHVRTGEQTLPQTLKVVVRVWETVLNSELNFSVKLPPSWAANDISTGRFLSDSGALHIVAFGESFKGSGLSSNNVNLYIYSSKFVPIFDPPIPKQNRTPVLLNGLSAQRYEYNQQVDIFGSEPLVREGLLVFTEHYIYNLSFSDDDENFSVNKANFQKMLTTLVIWED